MQEELLLSDAPWKNFMHNNVSLLGGILSEDFLLVIIYPSNQFKDIENSNIWKINHLGIQKNARYPIIRHAEPVRHSYSAKQINVAFYG